MYHVIVVLGAMSITMAVFNGIVIASATADEYRRQGELVQVRFVKPAAVTPAHVLPYNSVGSNWEIRR